METTSSTASSRRAFVGPVGTSVAAVGASAIPVAAHAAPLRGQDQTTKRNPITEYAGQGFPEQSQPWPGLASQMNPKPDHGESTYRGSGRLSGRKALITGGDSGIGRAAAIAFAREGADVAINYLPAEESDAREVVQLIKAAGRTAVAIPGDLKDPQFCTRLVDEAVRGLGGLDILVNNAARQQQRQSIADLTLEDFDATFKTNVYAMFLVTKAALPHLAAGSSIVNTASEQAYDPSPHLLDYAPTKAAIVAFTKALAKQIVKTGVRVNAVAPGPIWTPLQVSGGQPTEKLPQFGTETPYGRAGQPAELAAAFVTLASNESSYATGQVYGVNGGRGLP